MVNGRAGAASRPSGVPLAGRAVTVSPGFFLTGLSALENDMQRSVRLMNERSRFDIPGSMDAGRRVH
jgi:hypothetical protein